MNRPYVALVLAALLLCAGIASAQMVWNRAAHFDGQASVVIAPSPELDITGTFTIEAMVRLTDSVVYSGPYTLVCLRKAALPSAPLVDTGSVRPHLETDAHEC